jgi:hypothetical protein
MSASVTIQLGLDGQDPLVWPPPGSLGVGRQLELQRNEHEALNLVERVMGIDRDHELGRRVRASRTPRTVGSVLTGLISTVVGGSELNPQIVFRPMSQ